MRQEEYSEFVATLVKPGEDIILEMTPKKAHLTHMAMGVSGEAGELLDAIKKHTMYNKALDMANVIEELGDMEFYMEAIRNQLHIDRAACLARNKLKLDKRYQEKKFSNQQAQIRADKI